LKRALLLLLFATSAYAADPFMTHIGESSKALTAREYAKALKIDEKLIDDMLNSLGPGEDETKWFAVVVAHKALALAGLGREDQAIWYWHVALNIHPAVAGADMTVFGPPAEFLLKHPLEQPSVPYSKSETMTPPKLVRRVEPYYPYAARLARVTGIVIFQCMIDKQGNVRDVVIKRPLPGTMCYAAMEALREWKFTPATADGKPVDVLYNVTFNFKLIR
jgi:TonB family protein